MKNRRQMEEYWRKRIWEARQQANVASGSSMRGDVGPNSPDAPQFDSTGRPVGPMPAAETALSWQYEADRRTEQRKQALWGDAQNVMRQGTDLMQTYRPGGSAALASGMYQNRGAMYANQSMATETPDLLMRYREKAAYDAESKAEQAAREAKHQANTAMALQLVGTVAGAAVGGVGGAALGAAAGGLASRSSGGSSGVAAAPPPTFRGDSQGPSGGSGVSIQGSGGGMPGGPGGAVGGAGGGGSGGSNLRVPGGRGGTGSDEGGASGLQSGSGLQTQDDGDGPMSMFSSQEAAYNAMLANAGYNDGIYKDWAGSPVRSESTMTRIRAARFRMQKSYYPA